MAVAPDVIFVTEAFADGLVDTIREAILIKRGLEELLVCGIMNQSRVTHTVLSRSAERYGVAILTDCCTMVIEILHLHAVSTRARLRWSRAPCCKGRGADRLGM